MCFSHTQIDYSQLTETRRDKPDDPPLQGDKKRARAREKYGVGLARLTSVSRVMP